jgi:inner membrane protein
MLFKTHFAFGLFIYLLFFSYFQRPVLTLIGLLIGIIIVDLDSKKSKFGKAWYLRPIQWLTKHRKIFHTILFGIVITVLLSTINIEISFGFFVGFISHLILDSMTIHGIAPLYPFTQQKISGYIKSGGIGEDIIFVLLFLSNMLLLVINLVYLI